MRRWRKSTWACGLVFLATTTGAAPRPAEGPAAPPASLAQAHFELGLIHHEEVFRSLDRAIGEYEKAVEAKPDHAEAQYHLGLSYHTKAKLRGDKALYRKAMTAYRRYLEYEPGGALVKRASQNIRVIRARLR